MSQFKDRYSSFFDPFAGGNVVEGSDIFPKAKLLSLLHIDSPPPYETLKHVLNVVSAPVDSKSDQDRPIYTARINLDIPGQGTVIANCIAPMGLLFALSTNDPSKSSLYAVIDETSVEFWYGPALIEGSLLVDPTLFKGSLDSSYVLIPGKPVNDPLSFLRPKMPYPARYWLSIDHKNGILRFGRDYANLALTLYESTLKKRVDPGVLRWIDKNYAFIDSLTTAQVQQSGGNLKAPLQLVCQPLPVVEKLPPIIMPSEFITLDQLATGSATVPANLSTACQRLYANVAGANILLDAPDFPDFSQAIERSVNTEGLICQKLLKKKESEFGKPDYKSTYLRITLGADLGNSPGAPYVLEIWPAMHHSPIHNHADSHAVIKVLHGKIKAYYFTTLYEARPIGPPAKLEKGDITWIDPENYQVHQLSNENRDGSVCCTIQCYSYGAKDVRHYEAFDYVNDDTHKVIDQFEPNSDMRYEEFKAALKEEWSRR